MIQKEILHKIQKIHIRTNHLVNDIFAGEYESAFRGRGMEFEEVRGYNPGDDIRDIDWNVTARMGHPFIKVYREERELTIMLLVDVSSSGLFGTEKQFKNELSAEMASVMAFAAIRSNDKVGLIIFSDHVEKYIPPKKGRGHVWRVIKEVLEHRPRSTRTDIGAALHYLNTVCRRRAIAFLISDFIARDYEKLLRITNKKHDVIAVHISDPRERELPDVGIAELEDAEKGETLLVDTADAGLRSAFKNASEKLFQERLHMFRSAGIDCMDIRTNAPYIDAMLKFFRMREKRL
ncbi:MAG: DUF58 domain-containing protein [Proteobacteria bacterium]|nr:DUF58 domain-containing protein [Pseudomonadota bacterium]